jgi:hypothetical protein
MAILRLRPEPSFVQGKRYWKTLLIGSISFLVLILCVFLSRRVEEGKAFGLHELSIVLATIALIVAAIKFLVFFNRSKIERTKSQVEYEITDAGLSWRSPRLPGFFVPACDITGFTWRKKAIVVGLKERPKVLTLPAELVGIEQAPAMLGAMGVPEIRPGKYRVYSRLKIVVCLVGLFLCAGVSSLSRDPLQVAVAGICYLAALSVLSVQCRSPYQIGSMKNQRVTELLIFAGWTLMVVSRVWAVSHLHTHHSQGHDRLQLAKEFSPRR